MAPARIQQKLTESAAASRTEPSVLIPPNGALLGTYVSAPVVAELLNEVSAQMCVIRRSMAAEVAGGQPFAEPIGAEHLGDNEFFEGVRDGTYSKEVETALVNLSRNHCLAQLLRAGQIIDMMRRPFAAPAGMCVPTPDANDTAVA